MDCKAASRYNISFISVTFCPPATAGVAAREGETCLYLPGLYWAAFSSSRRAARYLHTVNISFIFIAVASDQLEVPGDHPLTEADQRQQDQQQEAEETS